VFERFTDRARRVVVLAQEEARMLDHNYIGTEHILLGLIREGEGVAARALEALKIPLDDVRREVEKVVGRGSEVSGGHIPFTPRAKKVLELSLREALQLGHNYIGTEHVLLGLIHEGEGVAAKALQSLGADLDRVRHTVIQLLSGDAPGPGDRPPDRPHRFRRGLRGALTPGDVRRAQALLSTAEASEEDYPLCPNCSASLAENASVRTRELTSEGESAQVIKIAYCAACGITLGIKIV
jgi:ATP-dependent Clp protease ATP-binding subunit ClpA